MPAINSTFYYNSNYGINSALKPQSGWTYELGYKVDDGTTAFTADVFHMKIKDKFFWDKEADGTNIMRNRDEWENTGLELNYKQKLDENWTANIGWTLQNPKLALRECGLRIQPRIFSTWELISTKASLYGIPDSLPTLIEK